MRAEVAMQATTGVVLVEIESTPTWPVRTVAPAEAMRVNVWVSLRLPKLRRGAQAWRLLLVLLVWLDRLSAEAGGYARLRLT